MKYIELFLRAMMGMALKMPSDLAVLASFNRLGGNFQKS
jgi:hypothetical protein